jgi:hypothetical protein
MWSVRTPSTDAHISKASSSVVNTVGHSRSGSKPKLSVTSSQADGIASSLK